MILDKIVARKRLEVKALLGRGLPTLKEEVAPPRGLQKALVDYPGLAIIAEAKKASPSKGVICPDFDPAQIAREYLAGGAQALSVLTDESFFQGALAYIPLVRAAVALPVLRKDFIIHEIQIREAAIYGADAILLIAAILALNQMHEYQALAAELGLDVLVEVHDEKEAEQALRAESRLIGINNRNLNDFTVDLQTTFRVMREIPPAIPIVSESGISSPVEMKELAEHGVRAALVGESLMRAPDRAAALRALRGEERAR